MTYISTHILTKRMTVFPPWFRLRIKIFQLTSSRRGWQLLRVLPTDFQHFNSHPHEEDDESRQDLRTWRKHFNSHPHEEDDSLDFGVSLRSYYFNSHPHEEDDDSPPNDSFRCFTYFNSHPHEEDDRFVHDSFELFAVISTHILTKRMTFYQSFEIS